MAVAAAADELALAVPKVLNLCCKLQAALEQLAPIELLVVLLPELLLLLPFISRPVAANACAPNSCKKSTLDQTI